MPLTTPRTRSPLIAHTLMLLTLVASGCGTKESMPGTALGTFTIAGTSTSNTCGAGLEAPSTWDFDVELSRDGSTLYWKQDGTMVSGTVDSASKATISDTVTSDMNAADAGVSSPSSVAGCTMSRVDSIVIDLGSDAEPTSISGTLTFAFAVTSGSDCSAQLTSSGGVYDALPCAIAYSFTAARTKAP